MQLHYTFGYDVLFDPVHLEVTRDAITRHIAAFFGDLREETVLSFNDLIPAVSDSESRPRTATSNASYRRLNTVIQNGRLSTRSLLWQLLSHVSAVAFSLESPYVSSQTSNALCISL